MYKNRWRARSIACLLLAAAIGLTACAGDPAVSDTTPVTPAGDTTTPEAPTTTQATDDPGILNGTYELEWTPEDLSEATGVEDTALIEGNSGVFQLVFTDGEFDQLWDNTTSVGDHCRGTYVLSGNRLLMTATTTLTDWDCGADTVGRGWLDATWELEGDQLILSDFAPTDIDGLHMWHEVFLGTKPLTRTTSAEDVDTVESKTLRLGITGGFAEPQFVHLRDTLADVSGGSLAIEIADEWTIASTDADVEQQIIGAVTSGAIDLGWVGSRAFAELGVTSFDALTAPFLIDSYALEDTVLDSDIPTRMLAGLDPELTGLAVIGGGLRKPIAVTAPLRNPNDFAGLTFHSWHSQGNATVIEALGATYNGGAGGERDAGLENGTIDGFENTIGGFRDKLNVVNYITANVVLWPATGVLVANTDRLSELTEAEKIWLHQAVTDTVNQSVELIIAFEAGMVDEICAEGGRFAVASEEDLEALREAVQPVYTELAQDTDTAGFIEEIEALKAEMPIELPSVPDDCQAE